MENLLLFLLCSAILVLSLFLGLILFALLFYFLLLRSTFENQRRRREEEEELRKKKSDFDKFVKNNNLSKSQTAELIEIRHRIEEFQRYDYRTFGFTNSTDYINNFVKNVELYVSSFNKTRQKTPSFAKEMLVEVYDILMRHPNECSFTQAAAAFAKKHNL